MKPTDDWGPAAKSNVGNTLECDDCALEDDDGGLQMTAGQGVNGSSFDNPSFKSAPTLGYTFETTIWDIDQLSLDVKFLGSTHKLL